MSKRPVCAGCGFILVRCLCSSLRPITNATHLIILQHPSEVNHALNTVALMKKSFQNITVLIGEDFSNNETLNHLIAEKKPALLFPTANSSVLKKSCDKKSDHFILIDGTWKKARKIFLLSKNLHSLEALRLETEQKSQYLIRSSKTENSLSTLEAGLCALALLEQELDTTSLQESFQKMIQFQIEKMGLEKFKKNYESEE